MITNSIIAYGDQLGAQMSTLAELVYIAKENNQDLCFHNEYKNFRRSYCILKNFDIPTRMSTGGADKIYPTFMASDSRTLLFAVQEKSKICGEL